MYTHQNHLLTWVEPDKKHLTLLQYFSITKPTSTDLSLGLVIRPPLPRFFPPGFLPGADFLGTTISFSCCEGCSPPEVTASSVCSLADGIVSY